MKMAGITYSVNEGTNKEGQETYELSVPVSHIMKPGMYTLGYNRQSGLAQFIGTKLSDERLIDIGGVGHTIASEMSNFLKGKESFVKAGLPHKRGYLMHGAPGCGKSCSIRLIAAEFMKAEPSGFVFFWPVNGNRLNVDAYYTLIRKACPDSPMLFIVEDIDTGITYFEQGMLNFLDGHERIDGVILLATTNYLEQVPDRLKARPSRIDRCIEVGMPSSRERAAYLKSFGTDEETIEQLVRMSDGLSFAHLKELYVSTVLLGYKPAEAKKLLRLPNPEEEAKYKHRKPIRIGEDDPEEQYD